MSRFLVSPSSPLHLASFSALPTLSLDMHNLVWCFWNISPLGGGPASIPPRPFHPLGVPPSQTTSIIHQPMLLTSVTFRFHAVAFFFLLSSAVVCEGSRVGFPSEPSLNSVEKQPLGQTVCWVMPCLVRTRHLGLPCQCFHGPDHVADHCRINRGFSSFRRF